MRRSMLKSKIHRATITGADLAYEGSISVDAILLQAADILPYEAVDVWDVTNGARFRTYAIAGEPGSGTICVNGAAAHLVSAGDLVIIGSFAEYEDAECAAHEPRLVFVDDANHMLPSRPEVPGPHRSPAA